MKRFQFIAVQNGPGAFVIVKQNPWGQGGALLSEEEAKEALEILKGKEVIATPIDQTATVDLIREIMRRHSKSLLICETPVDGQPGQNACMVAHSLALWDALGLCSFADQYLRRQVNDVVSPTRPL